MLRPEAQTGIEAQLKIIVELEAAQHTDAEPDVLAVALCHPLIACLIGVSIADEVKIEDEMKKELEERQKAGRTFSDALEDLRPYISDEMRCEIYRFAVNLLLERVKREGNFPCYKDIDIAVMRAAEVYEVVNKKLGKLKI